MSSSPLLVYLIFPVLLWVVLVALYLGPYRHLGDVNQIFETHRRPPTLRLILSGILALAILVFLVMQPVRFAILMEIFYAAIHGKITHIDFVQIIILLVFVAGILAELVVLIHQFYYLRICKSGISEYLPPVLPPLTDRAPLVAVLIPACNEPKEIVARSLGSAVRMAYANKRVILVENSRDPRRKKDALRLAREFENVEVFDIPNRGNKAGALNDARALLGSEVKYLLILDADQLVQGNMLTELVPMLEKQERLCLVQTAQAYENCQDSLLAYAVSQQQMLLYESVMEGKAAKGRAPCYGTNCVVRLSALDEVGGWDESNVTEDLATSYQFHAHGWISTYVRKIYAKGLAPDSLQAYWRQQLRWSSGNTALFLSLIAALIRGKSFVSRTIRGDYLCSAGFALVTFAIMILALTPTAILVLGLANGMELFFPPLILTRLKWASISLYPIYFIALLFPYFNMVPRGYPVRNMILTQGLVSITSPIYLRGIRQALWGGSKVFLGTSAENQVMRDQGVLSLLVAQQAVGFYVFTAAGSFCFSMAFQHPEDPVPWILTSWFFINAVSLGHFFLFRFAEAANRS